jgi:hypothetical protein
LGEGSRSIVIVRAFELELSKELVGGSEPLGAARAADASRQLTPKGG